jgi:hypothetical protein
MRQHSNSEPTDGHANGRARERAWWTVQELAQHYGVCLRSVYQAIDDERLVAHRFGSGRGGIRVADCDRVDWELRCRQSSAAAIDPLSIGPGGRSARLIEKHLDL